MKSVKGIEREKTRSIILSHYNAASDHKIAKSALAK